MSEGQWVIFSTDAAQKVSDDIADLLRQSQDQTLQHLQQMQNATDVGFTQLPHWHEQVSAFVAGTRLRYLRIIQMYHRHVIDHLAGQIATYNQAETAISDIVTDEL